jgi:membrane protease subunit HflC
MKEIETVEPKRQNVDDREEQSYLPFRDLYFIRVLAIVVFLFISLAFLFSVQVRSGENQLVLRMGSVRSVLKEPGLHFTLPYPIERTVYIDVRKQLFQTRHTEMLTQDKRNIILLSDAIWSVSDPVLFYQSVGVDADGSSQVAKERLDALITNAKISIIGGHPLSHLVSTNRDELYFASIEEELLERCSATAQEKYGITLHAIGLSRLSLPEQNIKSVFAQMRAERKQYAARYKAEGEKQAAEIRAQTDLEVAEIQSQSQKEVAEIEGKAKAEAAKIYAEAHAQNPDLYRFVRSLETLDESIGARSTMILRTDSAPFKLLVQPTGE